MNIIQFKLREKQPMENHLKIVGDHNDVTLYLDTRTGVISTALGHELIKEGVCDG